MDYAVYDMDKTITRRATWTRWLVFDATRRAPWRLLLLPLAGFAGLAYSLRLISRAQLKEASQSLMMGPARERHEVARIAAAFAAREVAAGMRPGARAQLAADRAAGLTIVMATASFDFYAGAIAARLGIDHVVATRSVWDGDRLRPRIDGANCYGAAKLAMLDTTFPAAVVVRAYSDHVSDAALLGRAEEGIAVNPSRALRILASARGWRIVDWG